MTIARMSQAFRPLEMFDWRETTILSVAVIILLSTQTIGEPITPYRCDSSEKIDEIRSSDESLQRVLRHDDKIFFVWPNRIVFTKLLRIDEDESAGKTKDSLVIGRLYEQEHKESRPSPELNPRPEDYQVVGHYYARSVNQTVELYGAPQKSDFYKDGYELSFNYTLAKQEGKVRLDLIKPDHFQYSSLYQALIDPNVQTQYVNFVDDEKFNLYVNFAIFKYEKGRMKLRSSVYAKDGHFLSTPLSGYFDKISGTELFVTYFGGQSVPEPFSVNWYVLAFESSHNRPRKRISFLYFKMEEDTTGLKASRSPSIVSQMHVKTDFEELFGCHSPFTNERQVKGIFYDSTSQLFFVFIKRFYLRVDYDLLLDRFRLQNGVYQSDLYNLEFESEQIEESVRFELISRRWVLASDRNYFVPFEHMFEIAVEEKSLKLKKIEADHRLTTCRGQTLLVNKQHVYCFEVYEYRYLNALANKSISKFTISSIFSETEVNLNGPLLLIFNYLDRVVFLSQSNFCVLRYENFKTEADHRITFVPDSQNKVICEQNCLFSATCNQTSPMKPIGPAVTGEPTIVTETNSDSESTTENQETSPTGLASETPYIGPENTMNTKSTTDFWEHLFGSKKAFQYVMFLFALLVFVVISVVLFAFLTKEQKETKKKDKSKEKTKKKQKHDRKLHRPLVHHPKPESKSPPSSLFSMETKETNKREQQPSKEEQFQYKSSPIVPSSAGLSKSFI